MKVERAKLTWFERLYIPSILNGFKVTLRHFFSWKRSKVYAEKQSSYSAKLTMQYPEEKWPVPDGYRGAPYLVKDEDANTKCVSCQLCEFDIILIWEKSIMIWEKNIFLTMHGLKTSLYLELLSRVRSMKDI